MLITAYQAARRKTRLLIASEFFALVATGAITYENDILTGVAAFCLLQIAILVMNYVLKNGEERSQERS
jgi:hypothetical protein